MFLELDKKKKENIAAIDIRGNRISYNKLICFAEQFSSVVTASFS